MNYKIIFNLIIINILLLITIEFCKFLYSNYFSFIFQTFKKAQKVHHIIKFTLNKTNEKKNNFLIQHQIYSGIEHLK